jgi:hypothetical protein
MTDTLEPTPTDRPPVVRAIEALRQFADLYRDDAAVILPYWRDYELLSHQEVHVVLRRFAPRPHPLDDGTGEQPPAGAQ